GYHPPGRIHRMLPLLPRPDRIPPMILIGITSARPTQHRDPDLFERIHHVHPDMIARPKTIVDTSPEILGKMPIDIPADDRPGSIPDRDIDRGLSECAGADA